MDIALATLLFTIAATVISAYTLIIAYFTKRQFKVYDDSAKETIRNTAEIEVLANRLDRLEKDVDASMKIIRGIEKNYISRFDEIKSFIADQMIGLSTEIKELGRLVTQVRINCASYGHSENVK